MSKSAAGPASREIIHTATSEFLEYDLEGPLQPDMSWLPLSLDDGQGAYLIRMQPGASTVRHRHSRREEYLILDGDLIEDDGTRLGPGDYVIYPPGTTHNSRTEKGCYLIAFDWLRHDGSPPDPPRTD